jgi:hypothetical protein
MAVHLVHRGTGLGSGLRNLLAQACDLSFELDHALHPLQVEAPGRQIPYTP